MVEVMKIMATSLERSGARTAALCLGHCGSHRQPTPLPELLDTHGHVWVSFLWGHCSFLLGPGTHEVLFVPSKCLFCKSRKSRDTWGNRHIWLWSIT